MTETDGKTTNGLNVEATSPTTDKADIKGKLVEFAWYLGKNGYADATISKCMKALKTLSNLEPTF